MGGTFFLVDISVAEGGGERGRRRDVQPHRHPCGMPPYGLRLPAVISLPLMPCWPLPQQLLPVSATGGGRRCCLVGAALAKRLGFPPCQGPPLLAGAVAARRLGGCTEEQLPGSDAVKSAAYGKHRLRPTSQSRANAVTAPLVGEPLAYRRVFGVWRFAPVCPAGAKSFPCGR